MGNSQDKTVEKRKIYRKQYGAVITKKRNKKNLSQKELADEIGVTRSSVSRYERGDMEIPASILPLISEVCNFQFSEYMEDFDYVRLAMRMDEFDVYFGDVIRKAAYPLPEWDMQYCKEEQERLIVELKKCLGENDCNELLCLTNLYEVMQEYKSNGMTDFMITLEEDIVRKARKLVRIVPGLWTLVFQITALSETIRQMEQGKS